jgi:putative membrane protein
MPGNRVRLRRPEHRPVVPGIHVFKVTTAKTVDGRVIGERSDPFSERLCPATSDRESASPANQSLGRVLFHQRNGAAHAMTTLFAFLHHLCAFTLVGALAIEFALIRQELTLASARRLLLTDMVLGIAAGALLVIGLLRVFFFEKGAAYYFHSHAFLIKLSLFIIVGLLSIIPTMEFLSWRGTLGAGQVPAIEARKLRRVTAVIHAELGAIVIILLSAAIMARGGWI